METRATLRGVRLSVDKGRLVADLIRGKKVDQALQFTANIVNGGISLYIRVECKYQFSCMFICNAFWIRTCLRLITFYSYFVSVCHKLNEKY